MKKQTFIIEITGTGFSAYAADLPVFTTGRNLHELKLNCLEALQLYYEDIHESCSLPDISLEVDLQQFFKYYHIINSRFLAHRIGMNASLLSQYVMGHKHPSARQTEKILRGIQEIGKELSDIGALRRSRV
ncbi:MAG TPA: hypothetical protein PKI34_06070 [Bacteroidales bacterium]|nr:hypothetical protein [Bacteroidales bacterium]